MTEEQGQQAWASAAEADRQRYYDALCHAKNALSMIVSRMERNIALPTRQELKTIAADIDRVFGSR